MLIGDKYHYGLKNQFPFFFNNILPMPHLSFFTALENRALTGKPFSQKIKQRVLALLREKACQAVAKTETIKENIQCLEMATHHNCPYSSFVLGCLYLGATLRKTDQRLSSHDWYNLFNGFIQQEPTVDNRHELIDLIPLEQVIQPDYAKAIQYFKLSAGLQNPQALLWLSQLALSQSSDIWLAKRYANEAASLILRKPVYLFKQFQFGEIIYLSYRTPSLIRELLDKGYIMQFLLDPEVKLGPEDTASLYILMTTSRDIALKFLEDEHFLSQFNPYQKSAVVQYVLTIFPDLYDELKKIFNHKKPKP